MLDWDDLRFFLALVRHGTLSAAAKELHVAQSTVGRRLASLEASLAVRLLNRTPDGYVSIRGGEGVLAYAERLEEQALALERQVGGRDTRLSGLIRVTCTEAVATHILAPGLAALHERNPDTMIELIPNVRELSLSMREADIAVRLKEADQQDLVVRRIGSIAFGLYASQPYLDQHGDCPLDDGCPGHHLVSQSEDLQDQTQSAWLADLAPRARVAIHTTSHEAAVIAALHGGGLACLARFRADQKAGLVRLSTPSPIPSAKIWLVVHRDNRHTPRIRLALDHITEHVRHLAARLSPADEASGVPQ